MKFSVSSCAKKPVAEVAKVVPTFEDAYDMQELCLTFDKANAKAIQSLSDKCEVFASLTIAEMKKASKELDSIGQESMEALAEAFGCSVADLDAMSLEDFSAKAATLMPRSMRDDAEASVENVGAIALVGALVAFYILFLVGLAASAGKWSKYEMPFLDQSVVRTMTANAKEALTDITANTFKASEYIKQIAGINKVLDFLNTDIKKFYDPSYKIVEIEKMAKNLWASPTTQAFAGEDDSAWWKEWRNAMPPRTFGTLGELGFTVQNLVKVCKDLEDLSTEVSRLWKHWVVIKNGRAERRKNEPGFFGRIKRYFTESQEETEKRHHAELILNAKYQGLRNLLYGIDACGRAMINDFIFIAVKTQNYLAKYETGTAKGAAKTKKA